MRRYEYITVEVDDALDTERACAQALVEASGDWDAWELAGQDGDTFVVRIGNGGEQQSRTIPERYRQDSPAGRLKSPGQHAR